MRSRLILFTSGVSPVLGCEHRHDVRRGTEETWARSCGTIPAPGPGIGRNLPVLGERKDPLDPGSRSRKDRRASVATDYDTPRKTDDDINEDSLEELKARRADLASSTVDVDETELAKANS